MHTLDLVTIIATGLMIGNELTVSLFINPVVKQLDIAAQTKALSLFAKYLGRAMPIWYAGCLVLLVTETILRKTETAFLPLLAAVILWAAIILFTILLLVPINNRIARLDATSQYTQWVGEHRHWERLHRLRILGLLIAFILLLQALLPAR
jgi:uncharacterized membrane protein